jgi:hypothetical protein
MQHQKVTTILRLAGFEAQRFSQIRNRLLPGYQASQQGQSVGVLCGSRYTVAEIRGALEAAGFSVATRPNTAIDALFVS